MLVIFGKHIADYQVIDRLKLRKVIAITAIFFCFFLLSQAQDSSVKKNKKYK